MFQNDESSPQVRSRQMHEFRIPGAGCSMGIIGHCMQTVVCSVDIITQQISRILF